MYSLDAIIKLMAKESVMGKEPSTQRSHPRHTTSINTTTSHETRSPNITRGAYSSGGFSNPYNRSKPLKRASLPNWKRQNSGSENDSNEGNGDSPGASRHESKAEIKSLPIPRGNLPYAKAKRAEYLERNLGKAEYLYRNAIKYNDRAESAVKDLASLLHQQGRTSEAVEILESYSHLVTEDVEKYQNLLENLHKQLVPSANCLNKFLKVSGLEAPSRIPDVLQLFNNPNRVLEVKIGSEGPEHRRVHFAVVKFSSHSAARKTLDAFQHWDKVKIEWMTSDGEVTGDANPKCFKLEQMRKNPVFEYLLFERDPENWLLTMPVDEKDHLGCAEVDYDVDPRVLGEELVDLVFDNRNPGTQ